ncbi:MAG: low temperature requirement protein A [Candidatus Moduliflexus flocculans]|nr:low temperature requirement protein A [Candidatus Moduliflexus flocculans]
MEHTTAPPTRSLLRRRGAADAGRVEMVELFFDLVFVFAITQLSHGLLGRPERAGRAAHGAAAGRGVVGLDLHLLGHKLARSRVAPRFEPACLC